MRDGDRVRIIKSIELFPIGKFEIGLLGTVQMTDGDGETEPYCLVRLDQQFPALAQWDNRLQVWSGAIPIVTAADFELVIVEE
jgi:hypothetical protein